MVEEVLKAAKAIVTELVSNPILAVGNPCAGLPEHGYRLAGQFHRQQVVLCAMGDENRHLRSVHLPDHRRPGAESLISLPVKLPWMDTANQSYTPVLPPG